MTRTRSDDRHLPVLDVVQRAEQLPDSMDPAMPAIGKWYYVTSKDGGESRRWLGCVTHIGSNYVELRGLDLAPKSRYDRDCQVRVHLDNFWTRCEHVPDADAILSGHVESHQRKVAELMEAVRATTARLSVGVGPMLSTGAETQALAVRKNEPMDEYKASLVKAKDETLPALFKQIEQTHEELSAWMGAKLIPLHAQSKALKPVIQAVEERIFSVQLYAGLVEDLKKIADGEPAPMTEKVRILQRRAYMDEECLAAYEVGGMEFKDIAAFDRWLAKPKNRDRLLPFPRCVVAFRVRRFDKEREVADLIDFINLSGDVQADKRTFLYIRNGQQIYRLSTEIEFGERLFPDTEHALTGALYADMFSGQVRGLISENEYLALVEEDRADTGKFRHHSPRSESYRPFTKDNVYYDDIATFIQKQIAEHNRLVLVLQGLLDRSTALHPHPPYVLWNADSFTQALDLIYDDSRALTTGAAPDFEAYRAKCNASLTAGSVTVGQEDVWELREGDKEAERYMQRYGKDYYSARFRPEGDPGPGRVARTERVDRNGRCHFRWVRRYDVWRGLQEHHREVVRHLRVERADILNVDAYQPGDFHIFFDDPRTRADYLKWAPLLLEAEEYHAGNRPLRKDEPMPARKPRTQGGSAAYRRRKHQRSFVMQAVRNSRPIHTTGGLTYEAGMLWRVTHGRGDSFHIQGITPDGQYEDTTRIVTGVSCSNLVIDPTVPSRPSKKAAG
jgi:hypothetical protein